jgi:hypothetical protein
MVDMKEPRLVDNLFDQESYNLLKDTMFNCPKTLESYDQGFGRYHVNHEILQEYTQKALPIAREYFNSQTLVPSYTLFSHYEGANAQLWKHKDDNACTYTLDMCVYQNQPWDLWVEGKNYTLNPNQALAYYGNDQEHWREAFPNPESQHVAMIFFHFVEPDHWFLTKGPGYIEVIRGRMSEAEYLDGR